jgi:hypothetical protein
MKYCFDCEVNVNEKHKNCPLCGRYLGKEGSFPLYQSMEKDAECPSVKVQEASFFSIFRQRLAWIVLLCIFGCILLNIILPYESLWSGYVVIGGMLCILGVITAINRKRRLYALISSCSILLPLSVVGLEIVARLDAAKSLAAFGVTLEFVVPSILLALIILCDIMMFVDKSKNKYYVSSLLLVSIISLLPQIAIWIIHKDLHGFMTVTLFFVSIINFGLILLINWKRMKSELQKKFFV